MAGHAYISYSRQDGGYARILVEHLGSAELPVWVDPYLSDEAYWDPALEDPIRAAAAVLVIMSPSSQNSDRVRGEILFAHRIGKPIIPLLLSGKAFFTTGAGPAIDVTGGLVPDDELLDELGRLCGTTVVHRIIASHASRSRLRAPVVAVVAAALVLVAGIGFAIASSRPSGEPQTSAPVTTTGVPTLPQVDPTTGLPVNLPTSGAARPSLTPTSTRKSPSPTGPGTPPVSTTASAAPPPLPTGLAVDVTPGSIVIGNTAVVTVTLSGSYPSALTVSLSSSDPTVADVPGTVTVAADSLTATFTVTSGLIAGNVTITASLVLAPSVSGSGPLAVTGD